MDQTISQFSIIILVPVLISMLANRLVQVLEEKIPWVHSRLIAIAIFALLTLISIHFAMNWDATLILPAWLNWDTTLILPLWLVPLLMFAFLLAVSTTKWMAELGYYAHPPTMAGSPTHVCLSARSLYYQMDCTLPLYFGRDVGIYTQVYCT